MENRYFYSIVTTGHELSKVAMDHAERCNNYCKYGSVVTDKVRDKFPPAAIPGGIKVISESTSPVVVNDNTYYMVTQLYCESISAE